MELITLTILQLPFHLVIYLKYRLKKSKKQLIPINQQTIVHNKLK